MMSDHMYGCLLYRTLWIVVFVFKQKTAYEMRISDGSSDVCASDLVAGGLDGAARLGDHVVADQAVHAGDADGGQKPADGGGNQGDQQRSEERRVGKECVRTCRSRC